MMTMPVDFWRISRICSSCAVEKPRPVRSLVSPAEE